MELFKLLGTIAIENGEALRALRDTQQEGGKTESKMSKAFSAMGKGAAVAGKAILTGLAVGGTAMAGLTVKALQLSGDLEQNMGGAEAVFGDLGNSISNMSTTIITGYDEATGKAITATSNLETVSKNAYKNMGLSQSDYLATANKMGALFKGAGFETQEALDLSSQAMQRAADVASIMGIDTEAAMEAVAGAAKGNFTMMDNLGVAMNDTAIAAYAASKGINKSTSEMSQQEKIGLAMEMFLEKTSYAAGNYARENETLAGSLSTAKAAFTNFLAGSGDVDSLVSSFSNLANVVVKSLTEIAPRLTQGLSDLVQQVVPLIPPLLNTLLPVLVDGAVTLIDGLVAAMPGIVGAIMAALPMLIEGVLQLITSLATALPQIIQPIVDALPQIIQSIVTALPTLIPALIDGLVQIIVMLCGMLPQIIQPIIDALPTIITAITDALLSNLPALILGVGQLIVALAAAIPSVLGALWEAIKGIFATLGSKILGFFEPVKTAISNAWEAMGSVPGLSSLKTMIEQVWGAIKGHIDTVINAIKNVVSTVWNAIKANISTTINAIKNVISTAWNAIKTIISNVMKLISSVLKGDWEGVKSAISNILNAIKSVISSVWNGIKSVISSVLNGIKSVVSSVWDGIKSVISSALNTIKTVISSVWNGIKGTISGVLNGIKTTVSKGFNDVKSKITGAFKDLPSKLKSIGGDLIKGLWNGISDKFSWLTSKIKGFASNVTDKLKGFFGIHSPSIVMRDEVGKMLALGVAEGIEDASGTAEGAAEDMAAKVVETAEKKLEEYKKYNDLTLADEVAFWNEIRSLTKDGTDARLQVDKKYLSAKASMDEQLMAAEEKLQSKLKETQEKIVDSFGLFDAVKVEAEVKSRKTLLDNIGDQTHALEVYESQLKKLKERIGDGDLFQEIAAMGINAIADIETLNIMTDAQLSEFTNQYTKKSEIAARIAAETAGAEYKAAMADIGFELVDINDLPIKELSASVSSTITTFFENIVATIEAEVEKFEAATDGATATATTNKGFQTRKEKEAEAGKTLYEIATEEGGFSLLRFLSQSDQEYKEISAAASLKDGGNNAKVVFSERYSPDGSEYWGRSVSVEKDGKTVLKKEQDAENNTIYDTTKRAMDVDPTEVKEASSNVVESIATSAEALGAKLDLLTPSSYQYNVSLSETDSAKITKIIELLDKMAGTLSEYFPQVMANMIRELRLDTGVLVGELAPAMNEELGRISSREDRGL